MPTMRRPWLLPFMIAAVTMIGPFAIDTVFPGLAGIGRQFSVDVAATQQLVGMYMLAFAVMSPFYGPMSDAVGRRPVMIGGLLVFLAASIGCAVAPSFPVLLGFRIVQGLASGAPIIVARTVIRDLYDGPKAQQMMSTVMMIFGAAPAVAPIVGGWLLLLGSWQVIFWFLAVIAALLGALVVGAMPESHPPERRIAFSAASVVGALWGLAKMPRFQLVTGTLAFNFGAQFLYIGAASIFIVDLLGQGEQDFWKFFVPMISAVMAGAFVSGRLAGKVESTTLVTASIAGVLSSSVVGVVLAAVPSTSGLPYAVIGPTLMAFCVAVSMPTLQLTLMDLAPRHRGSAMSWSAFTAGIVNAVGAGVLAPLVTQSVLTLAMGSLGLAVVAATCWAAFRATQPAS